MVTIEVKGLSKKYGRIKALDNISFTINKGEIVGFLGPNGAGKSTVMNIITGYLSSSEGSVRVCGYDVLDNPKEVKKRIGFLPENPSVYMDMTVQEYLKLVCDLKLVDRKKKRKRIDDVMEFVGITDVRKRLIGNLSKGYRQRVGLAQALVNDPEVLILDEPTVGLDPKQIVEIRNLIIELGKNHTIMLSSHILPEVNSVCDRVIIINKGKIAAVDTPANLSKKFDSVSKVSASIIGPVNQVSKAIKQIEGINNVEVVNENSNLNDRADYIIEYDKNVDIRPELFSEMTKSGHNIVELKSLNMTLEEVFLHIVTEEKEVG